MPSRSPDMHSGFPDMPSRSSDMPSGSPDMPSRSSDMPSGSPNMPSRSGDMPSGSADMPIFIKNKRILMVEASSHEEKMNKKHIAFGNCHDLQVVEKSGFKMALSKNPLHYFG